MKAPSAGWPAERGRDALSKRALVALVSSTTLNMLCLLPVPGSGRADGLGGPLWINLKLMTPSRSSLGAAASWDSHYNTRLTIISPLAALIALMVSATHGTCGRGSGGIDIVSTLSGVSV